MPDPSTSLRTGRIVGPTKRRRAPFDKLRAWLESAPTGRRRGDLFPVQVTVLLLVATCLPSCLLAAQRPEPFVFIYGAQDAAVIPEVAVLGMNTLYLSPETVDSIELAKLEDCIEVAEQHGLKTIVGIPTVSHAFELLPSPGGKRYREWVAELIARVVERFRDNPNVVAWATGDFLAEVIDYNAADFRAYMQRWHGDIDAINDWWGSRFTNWGDVTQPAARKMDADFAFGVGRASIDVADYRRQAFHDVMAHWSKTIKGLDDSRPLMTGRIALYRDLTAIPADYDIVCPFMPPDLLDPDALTHNVHAVDTARRAGRFEVAPCLTVPLTEDAYRRGDLGRWMVLAALHGACGVGLADWQRIKDSSAPRVVARGLTGTMTSVRTSETFRCHPQPSVAFVYEPYASGFEHGGSPVYGYLEKCSEGEPNNPFWALRVGCRYGLTDYLTLDDLPLTDLSRYGVIFAPLPLRLPRSVQLQLVEFVRTGGALVCDIGAGMCETGTWLALPPELGGLFGVERLVGMEEVARDLRIAWPPAWLPSMQHGARTQGSYGGARKAEGVAATERRGRHVSGPACYAAIADDAGAIAVLGSKFHEGKRVVAGVIGNKPGLGVTCFATHRLWANWISSDPVYEAFHHDLCMRRAKVELLDVPFWTSGICATAIEDGIAVANGLPRTAGAEVVYYGAEHALYTNAACVYSAMARRPDGTRSGAARLSVELPELSLVACGRLPVLVQPFTDTCMARLVEQSPQRLVIEVGGDGATVTRQRDGALRIGQGAPTEIRFTISDGAYPVRPGSAHHVRIDMGRAGVVEGDVTASAAGQIRFSETIGHGVVTVRGEA